MGCNAWNHDPGCSCGWGGEGRQGGYSSNLTATPYDAGRIWSRHGRLENKSFTTPNANCPICGARVFFHQAINGGRVYFDSLGPPWPKHPCMDRSLANRNDAFQSGNRPKKQAEEGIEPRNILHGSPSRIWEPFILKERPSEAGALVWCSVRIRPFGTISRIPIPKKAWTGAPIYWRWSSQAGRIEIETINVAIDLLPTTIRLLTPAWFEKGDELNVAGATKLWDLPHPPATRWTQIGLEFSSFPQVDAGQKGFGFQARKRFIDWDLARKCFELAAEAGDWEGANLLGIIYRDGLGVTPDSLRAVRFFWQAAFSYEAVALENLAHCYEEGIGCERNLEMAALLRMIIAQRQGKKSS